MANYLTFVDLYNAVEQALKITQGSKRNYVKSVINSVYQNEICGCDDLFPLFWLRKLADDVDSKAPATISGITGADPGVVTTAAAHGFVSGDVVMIHSVAGMTEVNNRLFKAGTVGSTTTFNLSDLDGSDVDTSGYTAYVSGGSVSHFGCSLSGSVDSVIMAGWHGYEPMEEVDHVGLSDGTQWFDSSTQRPTKYTVQRTYDGSTGATNLLMWFPGADAAYDLRYWYVERPPRLSADADVPKLPWRFHDTIIAGAITRLAESSAQVENAVIWPSLYKMQLGAIRSYNREYWAKYEQRKKENTKPFLL